VGAVAVREETLRTMRWRRSAAAARVRVHTIVTS